MKVGEGIPDAGPAQAVNDEGVFIDVAVVVEGHEVAPDHEGVGAEHRGGEREREVGGAAVFGEAGGHGPDWDAGGVPAWRRQMANVE